jgi:8-oxo-dGTP diphosphatase
VPHAYPGKRILLDVYRVSRFSGRPHGRERQALAWSPMDKLATYPMPPADRPVVSALTQPAQYLITPEPQDSASAFLDAIQAALDSGIRLVQLRVADARRAELAAPAKVLCDRAGAQLMLNSDLALAIELGCGLHLRASQLAGLATRPLSAGVPVAASCHEPVDLQRAEALGLDFVVLGPVAETGSHPGVPAMGWKRFAELREHCSLPIYALGGMRPGDHEAARRHGAQGIAAISGLWPLPIA